MNRRLFCPEMQARQQNFCLKIFFFNPTGFDKWQILMTNEAIRVYFCLLCLMSRFIFLFLLIPFFFSCSDKYKPFKSQYTFKSKDGIPDYSDLNYWAAHPWKRDPSDSIPLPLRNEPIDSSVDVFFLHPTTLLSCLNQKSIMLLLTMIISMLKLIILLFYTRPAYSTSNAGCLPQDTGRRISVPFF